MAGGDQLLTSRTIIIVKFICALLFHFKFESEIRNGLQMMKYVALHTDHFEFPKRAFLIGMINFLILNLVEFINMWNLSNLSEGSV